MATLIYDSTKMVEFIRKLEDADMYNMEDVRDFLYAGADIFVEEVIVICCSLPVPLSHAVTFTMPLASISKVTSI